ncbi:hypothetical protein Tco_0423363, partial [Tanacetum coccineum]
MSHIPKKPNLEFGDCSAPTDGRSCSSELPLIINPMHETSAPVKIDVMKKADQFASNQTKNDGSF